MIPQFADDGSAPSNVTNLNEYLRRRATSGESAMDRLAALQAQMAHSATAAQDMNAQLAQLRAHGQDPNEIAEAEVDASGNLTDLRLHERAKGYPLALVAASVVKAAAAARAALGEQTRAVVADTMGADSASGKAVLDQLERRFGVADQGGER